MADIRVRADERPSWVRHFLITAVGILSVTLLVAIVVPDDPGSGLGVAVVLGGATLDVGILLVMLRSLAEEWFSAVEVVDDSDVQ